VDRAALLAALEQLRMAPAGEAGKRHPHKPLLLLWLLGRVQRGETTAVSYDEAQEPVDRLLAEFGTPARRSKDRAAMPFFHLESELWVKEATDPSVELSDSGGRLRRAGASGRLRPEVEALLQQDPTLVADAARLLLDEHFTDTHVDLICGEVGLVLDDAPRSAGSLVERRRRDPRFRPTVLQAYGYTCAMCGWDGRFMQQSVGLAAAHIRWHGHDGPDTVDNGLALCDLHHKLLDLGVVGLTPDLHLVVADDFVADSEVGHRLGHELHGKPVKTPQPRFDGPSEAHVEWHRSQVFRGAA
jgi:putative restriction endonuclease